MSPTAEQANPPVALEAAESLLEDGELMILSIKPSRWFVLWMSWPVLAVVAVAAGGAAAMAWFGFGLADRKLINWLCAGVAGVRLVMAAGQWASLRYILTSRRLLRVSADGATELPLTCVHFAGVAQSASQRTLGMGDVGFTGETGRALPMLWDCTPQPDNVCQAVNEAIAKAHR